MTIFSKVFTINVVLQLIDLEYSRNLMQTFLEADQFLSVFCPDFILYLFTDFILVLFNDLPLQLLTDIPQIGPLFEFIFFCFTFLVTLLSCLLNKVLQSIFFCLSFLKYLLNPFINVKRLVPILAILFFIMSTSQLRLYLQPYLQNVEDGISDIFNMSKNWSNYFTSKEAFNDTDDYLQSLFTVTYPDKIMNMLTHFIIDLKIIDFIIFFINIVKTVIKNIIIICVSLLKKVLHTLKLFGLALLDYPYKIWTILMFVLKHLVLKPLRILLNLVFETLNYVLQLLRILLNIVFEILNYVINFLFY